MISERLFQTVCWVLLHSLWQGLLLALLTGLTMVLSKKANAALRYNLLCGLLMLFVVVVAGTFYYEWQTYQFSKDPGILGSDVDKIINSALVQVPAHTAQPVTGPIQLFLHRFSGYFNEHASLVVTIWFVLFMAKCISILSGLVQVQRIKHYRTTSVSEIWLEKIKVLARRLQVTVPVQLLESAIVRVPVVIGWLKPTILLPLGLLTKLSPQEVESILLHELAHIRRRDYLVNLLQSFLDTLFFFNPAVVWISSLIRTERENCCDDMAIEESGSKKQFISALVSFHQYDALGRGLSIGFAGRKNSLVDRVRRITGNRNNSLNQKEKGLLLISFLVLGIFLVAFSSNQPKPILKINPDVPATEKIKSSPKQSAPAITTPVKKINHNASEAKSEAKKREDLKIVKPGHDTNPRNGDVRVSVNSRIEDKHSQAEPGLEQLGYGQIDESMKRKLRDHGVNADYIEDLASLGYRNVPLDILLKMRNHGVDADYLNSMKVLGYWPLSLDEAKEMIDHGVNPDLLKAWSAAGYQKMPLNQVKDLKDHGVSPEFVRSLRALGFNQISLETAMNLKDHGVTAEMIETMHDMGFTTISLQQAQNLQDHGVTPAFIRQMRQKTGSDHTLEEFIALKDAL